MRAVRPSRGRGWRGSVIGARPALEDGALSRSPGRDLTPADLLPADCFCSLSDLLADGRYPAADPGLPEDS